MTGIIKKKFTPAILILVLVFTIFMVSTGSALETSTPQVLEFVPAEGTTVNSSDCTVSMTVYDPDLILEAGYYIKVNGSPINSVITFPGHWEEDEWDSWWVTDSFDQATISGRATGLPDGDQAVEIKACDRLGNSVVKQWNFTVAEPPHFSFMSLANGSTVNNNTTVSVKVTDNSRVDPSSIVMTVDGLPVDAEFDISSGIVTYTAQPALLDGTHVIGIFARDVSGNEASASWGYTVQTAGPRLTFAGAGATFTVANPALSVWAQSNVNLDSSTASMSVDGQPVSTDFTYKGHWEYDFEMDPWYVIDSYNEAEIKGFPSNLKDGNHTVSVVAEDALGNMTTSQWNFTVNAKPVFSEPSPANGAKTTDNTGFSVKLTDNDSVVPTSIAVYLDGGQVPALFDPATGLLSYKPAGGIPDGTHRVDVTAADAAGNLSAYNWTFTVQTAGPELIFADAGKTFDTCSPAVSVALKSNVKIIDTGAVMTIDGRPVTASFTYKGYLYQDPYEDFSYWVVESYNEGTLTLNPVVLSDGAHEITVTARDALGNVASKSWNFSVAQKPVISGLEPSNGSTVSSKTPIIKAVISDPNGPAIDQSSIKLVIDNKQVVPAVYESGDGLSISYTTGALADDSHHEVLLTASDTAVSPNTAAAGWKFYINSKGDMAVDAKGCGSCHTLNEYDKYVHSEGPMGVTVQDPSPTHFYGNKCSHCHSGCRDETCGYCHNGDPMPQYDDNGELIPSPPGNPSLAAGQNCLYCHSTDNGGWVPSSYPAYHYYWVNNMVNTGLDPIKPLYPDLYYTVRHDILPLHRIEKGSCNQCHSIYLTREHNRVSSQGERLTCASCHSTNDIAVQQAIAAGNKDCSACHSQADHEAVHSGGPDPACRNCHKATLTQEHLSNTTTSGNNYTCDTCHSSTGKQVKRTIAANNLDCSGCHSQGHNLAIAGKVPADIPLYEGFEWSNPMEASIYSGDAAAPPGYEAGQKVISNRRNNVTPAAVWSFYNQQLSAQGWSLVSGAPSGSDSYFSAEFTKGGRYVVIQCYNTSDGPGSGQPVAAGYRIAIWYK